MTAAHGLQGNGGPKRFRHPEAFCLMQYRSDDGTEAEVLWNSRDGVTPFVITSRSGVEMRHVKWGSDRRVPGYEPRPGQRVFVDATLELVTPSLKRYVDRIWNMPEYPASARWDTKQEAFDALLPSWLQEGAPWVIETPGVPNAEW